MSDQAKRIAAGVLLVLAIVLGVAALLMWQKADSDAEKNPYASVFGLEDPPPADHTASIIMLAGGGIAVVSSVILFAGSRSNTPTRSQ